MDINRLRPRDEEGENGGGAQDKCLEILQDAEVESFEATPNTISPFESSTLKWKVKESTGFQVFLNNESVTRSGTKVVSPVSTSTYFLVAHCLSARKNLGRAQVVVNNSGCQTFTVTSAGTLKQELKGTLDYIVITLLN